MDKKFTDQKEQQLIENVFFGLNEDMNKLSRDLLARGEGVVFGDEDESKAAKPVEEAKPTKLDEEVDLDKTETENATNAQDTTEGTTE
jgi:hypothetical protein